ncbi:hypothetical protein AC249_AIPGENE14797, partial [Exaiptasia diaphana]
MNTFGKTNKELKENVDHLVRVLSSTCFSHAEEHLEGHWKTQDQAWIERQAEVDRAEEEFLNLELVERDLIENLNTLMDISYHLEAYFTREGVEFRDKIREIKGGRDRIHRVPTELGKECGVVPGSGEDQILSDFGSDDVGDDKNAMPHATFFTIDMSPTREEDNVNLFGLDRYQENVRVMGVLVTLSENLVR